MHESSLGEVFLIHLLALEEINFLSSDENGVRQDLIPHVFHENG